MTKKEIQELKEMMTELDRMRNMIEIIDNKIFDIHMTIWRKIMDAEGK